VWPPVIDPSRCRDIVEREVRSKGHVCDSEIGGTQHRAISALYVRVGELAILWDILILRGGVEACDGSILDDGHTPGRAGADRIGLIPFAIGQAPVAQASLENAADLPTSQRLNESTISGKPRRRAKKLDGAVVVPDALLHVLDPPADIRDLPCLALPLWWVDSHHESVPGVWAQEVWPAIEPARRALGAIAAAAIELLPRRHPSDVSPEGPEHAGGALWPTGSDPTIEVVPDRPFGSESCVPGAVVGPRIPLGPTQIFHHNV